MATDRPRSWSDSRGFTLVEIMFGAGISSIITLGVITSLTFLGRNLVRVAHHSDLQSRAAIASATLQKDVSMTTGVQAISATSLTLTVDKGSAVESVSYSYSSATGTVTRTDPAHTYTVLRNVTALHWTFSDADSTEISIASAVRKIELDASTAVGDAGSSTRVTYQLVTPAMIVAGSSL